MLDKRRDADLAVADLLVSTDFLKPHQLDKAYACCRDEGKPLCDILLDKGIVELRLMSCGFTVLNEVWQGRLPLQSARTVLYLMGHFRLPLHEAMAKLGVTQSRNPWQAQLDALADVQSNIRQ
jgi:hypothetical protein